MMMIMLNQDKAAMSAREGAEETEREQEKLRREEIWALKEGEQQVLEGLQTGNSRCWKGCRSCGAGVYWCVQRAQRCWWRLGLPNSGLHLDCENKTH